MPSFISKLFSDSSDVSCMRVMSLLSLLAAVVIAFFSVLKGRDLSADSSVIGIFVGAAFSGKAVQKVIELKG